jgi:hypothetical protein
MLINFAQVLRALPGGANRIAQIANQARPPADHLFATILPERQEAGWDVKAANMLIRTTMAGMVGMDSVYPPGGAAEASTFAERTAKIAIHVPLTEEQLRAIDETIRAMGGADTARSKEALAEEALNFFDKVIVAGMQDRSEWLRGKCLNFGIINWTFNQKVLNVDYQVPVANFLTHRTGTDAYAGSTSKFWTDIRSLQRIVGDVRAFIIGPDLADDIINNPVNNIQVVTNNLGVMSVQRFVSIAGAPAAASTDARDRITLVKYGAEAEIFDLANPGKTVKVLFHPRTHLLAIGANTQRGYKPGQGSTPNPQNGVELGYYKLGPTMEGGSLGRWGQLFTPENEPWALHGRGASNELPVMTAPEKLARASSDVSV